MAKLRLFIVACILAGAGGFVGSVLGNGFGRQGLFIGGFVGGVAIAPLTAFIAKWRGWILRNQVWTTAAGSALGFIAAATVAVNTLSSPVGPVLSTALTGIGAILGSQMAASK
jgi:hypothetical protein